MDLMRQKCLIEANPISERMDTTIRHNQRQLFLGANFGQVNARFLLGADGLSIGHFSSLVTVKVSP